MGSHILLLFTIELKHLFQIFLNGLRICLFLLSLFVIFVKLICIILIFINVFRFCFLFLVFILLCIFIFFLNLWLCIILVSSLFFLSECRLIRLLSFYLLLFFIVLNCKHFIIFNAVLEQLNSSFIIELRFFFI